MTLGIGFQITDMMFDDNRFQWWFDWVKRLKPGYINILRAAQKKEALERALHVVRDTPTKVMIRNYYDGFKDEDVMKIYSGTGSKTWLAAAGRYYSDFISQYAGTGLIPVTCNEISFSDYTDYSLFFGEVIRLANLDDIIVAVGRFPTHHPLESTWDSLIPLWYKMGFEGNAIYSPNAYYVPDNLDGLLKQVRFVEYMEERTDYRPNQVVFGEYARLRTLSDAYNGWGSISGLSEEQNAVEMLDHYKRILKPLGWHVNIFDIGNWKKSFGIGGPTMVEIESDIENLQVAQGGEQEEAVVVSPRTIEAGAYVNLRTGPGTTFPAPGPAGSNVGKLFAGEQATSLEPYTQTLLKLANTDKNQWLRIQTANLPEAYVAAWVVRRVDIAPPPPPPDPDTDPDLEELTEQVKFLAEELIRLNAEKLNRAEVVALFAPYAKKTDVWQILLDKLNGVGKLVVDSFSIRK